MIQEKMRDELNLQVKYELESAYLYLAMAAWAKAQGLDGMSQWMKVQTQEELVHAMKFFDHLLERGSRVRLLPLEIKKTEWKSAQEAFADAYEHEQFITGRIHHLAKLSDELGDYTSQPLLHWFINEQIEEEASTQKVAEDLKKAGGNDAAGLMIDRELGTRVFVPPPPGAAQG